MQIDVEGDTIACLTLALRLRLKRHDVCVISDDHVVDIAEDFTLPAPYRDLFLKTGDALETVLPLAEVPPLAHIDRRHPLMQEAAAIWSAVRVGNYRSRRTIAAALRGHDATTREAVLSYVSAHGLDADRIGDAALVLPYLDLTFGRWRFEAGMPALSNELRARCARIGVTFAAAQRGAQDIGAADIDAELRTMLSVQRRWRADIIAPHELGSRLGLPFIGMAAETIADRFGRA